MGLGYDDCNYGKGWPNVWRMGRQIRKTRRRPIRAGRMQIRVAVVGNVTDERDVDEMELS